MKHLLLVGRAGVGKTTVIKRVVHALRGASIDGFLTEESLEQGEPAGYWLSPVDGRQVLLAHRRLHDRDVRGRTCQVGLYQVNVSVLDQVAVPLILRALTRAQVIVLDELGAMTLCAERVEPMVRMALDRAPCLVATAGLAPLPFVDALKGRRDVEVMPVTLDNREALTEELIARLQARCDRDPAVRALQRQADDICELIVAGDAPQVDIEIRQAALREDVARRSPAQQEKYALLYDRRFRRLWQQFRMPQG